MPRYSGVLAFLCLVATCVGINMIRYPAVSAMISGKSPEQKTASDLKTTSDLSSEKKFSEKDEKNKASDSKPGYKNQNSASNASPVDSSGSSTTSYRNYSPKDSEKTSGIGNKPVSSSSFSNSPTPSYRGSDSSLKSTERDKDKEERKTDFSGSTSSSQMPSYRSGSSGMNTEKTNAEKINTEKSTTSESLPPYRSSYGSGSNSSGSNDKNSGSNDRNNSGSSFKASGSKEMDDFMSLEKKYESGEVTPSYASHYSGESTIPESGSPSGSPGTQPVLSAAERFEIQKSQPFASKTMETRSNTKETSYYIPPSSPVTGGGPNLAVPMSAPPETSASFEPIPLPTVSPESSTSD